MSTTIEWTHVPGYRGDVWNPTTGCNKVSQGCKNCYAETMHRRLHAMGVKGYDRPFLEGARPMPERLHKPLKTKTPTAYFVNSMSDLFHEAVPFSFIDQVFAVMALTPQHTYQILTKRPERMADYFHRVITVDEVVREANNQFHKHVRPLQDWLIMNVDELGGWPLKNVWLGTSVEDQSTADARIPHLLRCPAAVRFLSCEPLLGPVDLRAFQQHTVSSDAYTVFTPFHWVIAGGESGPKARPMHPGWARGLRDQCHAAGVPFFFKQWGEHAPGSHPDIHTIHESGVALGVDGTHQSGRPYSLGSVFMKKVGKHAAGRLLDGVEHNEFPRTA